MMDADPSTSSRQIFQETSFMPIAWTIAVGTKIAGGAEVMPSTWKIPKKTS
jgi:hypothetical protein